MEKKPRVLVTYGYHLGEKFAVDVGVEFGKMNLEDVTVKGLEGKKPRKPDEDIFADSRRLRSDWLKGKTVYPEDLALIRKKVGAKYGIDLHDEVPHRKWVFQHLDDPAVSAEIGIKYDLVGHMGYERARRLIHPFRKRWNEMCARKEISETSSFCCDCYYLTYHMRRPCRADIISLEFLTCLSDITVEEGVYFLKEIVKYLQSNG